MYQLQTPSKGKQGAICTDIEGAKRLQDYANALFPKIKHSIVQTNKHK